MRRYWMFVTAPLGALVGWLAGKVLPTWAIVVLALAVPVGLLAYFRWSDRRFMAKMVVEMAEDMLRREER